MLRLKKILGQQILLRPGIFWPRIVSNQYQPSGAGGTRSPPATPHRLPVGPKMADGVWKGVQS